ncbi:MAG: hypothetical protein R2932_02320 [Caldilineaceae bacterium]
MALSTNRFHTLTLLILATILLGILSRLVTTGVVLWDKYLGDALYAILVYLLLSLGRWRSLWGKALVALVIMVAIESFSTDGNPLPVQPAPRGCPGSWRLCSAPTSVG